MNQYSYSRGRDSVSSRRRSRRRRRKNYVPYIIGILLILLLVILLFVVIKKDKKPAAEIESTQQAAVDTSRISSDISIDMSLITGKSDDIVPVTGMNHEEITKKLVSMYKWDLQVINSQAAVGETVVPTADADMTTEAATMGDAEHPDELSGEGDEVQSDMIVKKSIEVPDIVLPEIESIVSEVFDYDKSVINTDSEESSQKTFIVRLSNYEDVVSEVASTAGRMWYKEAKGGSIGSFDKETETFIMETADNGYVVDEGKVYSDIKAAIESHDYDKKLPVSGKVINISESKDFPEYTIIGKFTTKTTDNPVRNKNVTLACELLNGTIVRPGEEFSFNNTVGQRTEEKGFGAAAAYNNGEVVQEIGGGVCQCSTTLYNAVLQAGLKTTRRVSHTFEPSYVTPGQDATVSWGGPDYRFANLPAISDYSNEEMFAIGILAHYKDRTVTVEIYGRPVLKEGITYKLHSTKISDMELVRVLIEPDSGREPETGTTGSKWTTNLVIKNGDEVISDKKDHDTIYTGHIEYYLEEESSEELPTDIIDSGDGDDNTETAAGPGGTVIYSQKLDSNQDGPGGSKKKTDTETTQASTKSHTETQPTENEEDYYNYSSSEVYPGVADDDEPDSVSPFDALR